MSRNENQNVDMAIRQQMFAESDRCGSDCSGFSRPIAAEIAALNLVVKVLQRLPPDFRRNVKPNFRTLELWSA